MTEQPDIPRETLETYAILKEAIVERRKDDALYVYKPHPKQEVFARSVLDAEYNENWLCCANRFGKSDIGAYCGSKFAREGLPEKYRKSDLMVSGGKNVFLTDYATSGWVVGLDNNVLRDTIQPKYFDNDYVPPGSTHEPFIPGREIAHWNKEDNIIKLKNGSIVGFKSCEADTGKFAAAGKDWIHYDEAPPKRIYEESSFRIEAGRPLLLFGTCTLLPPEGVVGGINWVYSEIIKKHQRGELPHIAVFGGAIWDNPYISKEEIAKLASKWPMDSIIGRIRLGGEYLSGLLGSRAYTSFQEEFHVVKDMQPIDMDRPLAWMWDFNVEPMVTLVGQYLQKFRFYDELVFETGGDIDLMCELFYNRYGLNHRSEIWMYADATGNNRSAAAPRETPSCILTIQRWFQLKGITLRKKIPESNPMVQDRLAAFNRQLRYDDGTSYVEMHPRCRGLRDDLDEVLLAEDGGIKKTTNRKDPYFMRTHYTDAAGYWIAYEAPVQRAGRRRVQHKIKTPSYGFTDTRDNRIIIGGPAG